MRHFELGHALAEVINDLADLLLANQEINVRVVVRKYLVKQRLSESGIEDHRAVGANRLVVRRHNALKAQLDLGTNLELTKIVGHNGLRKRGEGTPLTLETVKGHRQVVSTNDHLVRRQSDRATISWLENVVRRQHEDAGLSLGLRAQRQVHSHLVTIEVGIEGRANERVQLDSFTFNELRLEGLNTQAVQRRCAVQQNRMLLNDLLEDVPHHRTLTLNHALSRLHILSVLKVSQTLHDERLEQLQRHRLRQTTLVHLELRTDDNDRTAGVVDALTKQILTETALLALKHVRQRFQRAVTRTAHRTPTTTVIEQRVDSLLEHSLLVVNDDLRGAKINQPLEAVVSVNDATVKVVEVRGGEAATVELHHRAQVRRDDRHAVQHHSLRRVTGIEESLHHLKALKGAGLLLAATSLDNLAQLLRLTLEVEIVQTTLNRLGTHRALKVLAEARLHLAVENLVTLKVLNLEVLEAIPHRVQTINLALSAGFNMLELLLGTVLDLAPHVSLGTVGLELSHVFLKLDPAGLQLGITTLLQPRPLGLHLGLQRRKVTVASLIVDGGDHIGREVNDLLEVLRSDIEQVPQTGGNPLEIPDMGHRGNQLNMSHTLTTHVGAGHLDAAALTDDALEADALVLAAVALPVPGRSEDLLAEQAVTLGFEGAVVNGLGLLDLAVAPRTDLVGRGQADLQPVVVVGVQHDCSLSPTRVGGSPSSSGRVPVGVSV